MQDIWTIKLSTAHLTKLGSTAVEYLERILQQANPSLLCCVHHMLLEYIIKPFSHNFPHQASFTINRQIQISISSVFFVEVNVQSQQWRIKCHPQGLCSMVDVCQNQGLNLASPVKGQLSPSSFCKPSNRSSTGSSSITAKHGTERESLTQVQKTIENMTWERLNCLALQHWTPRVRPVRGSPVPTWEPLLSWRNSPSSCFSFLSSGRPQPGIPMLLESGKMMVPCHLSGQWLTVSLRILKLWGQRNFHEGKQTWESLLQIGTKLWRRSHLSSLLRCWRLQNISVRGKLNQ